MYPVQPIRKKQDEKGRIYREVRCIAHVQNKDGTTRVCRAFICDEYIRVGRVRFTCFKCGTIWTMEFNEPEAKEPEAAETAVEHEKSI